MPKRQHNELRPLKMTPHYLEHPEGSVLIECGGTKVICTASIEERIPKWLMGTGKGWVTAEYDMLPRATSNRRQRDSHRGKLNGRTQEISRLIGRALRAVTDLSALGECSITVDCDVIQADGGTRTASITGAFVALALALKEKIGGDPLEKILTDHVAAISVGIINQETVLDLDYNLDSRADVDMNIIMTGNGNLAEVQGTAEGAAFSREQMNEMLDLALGSLPALVEAQKVAIGTPRGEAPQSS